MLIRSRRFRRYLQQTNAWESFVSEKQSIEFVTALVALVGVVVLIGVVYFLTAGLFADSAGGAGTPTQVAARLAPIGSVTVAEPAAPAEQVAAAAPEAAAAAAPTEVTTAPAAEAPENGKGEAIYAQSCFACHATGAAGAPLLGDAATWGPRIAQGMDALMATVVNGKGAMPPRGTCAACSDEDLRAAVEYMLSKVE
jgi:cytochrome c5